MDDSKHFVLASSIAVSAYLPKHSFLILTPLLIESRDVPSRCRTKSRPQAHVQFIFPVYRKRSIPGIKLQTRLRTWISFVRRSTTGLRLVKCCHSHFRHWTPQESHLGTLSQSRRPRYYCPPRVQPQVQHRRMNSTSRGTRHVRHRHHCNEDVMRTAIWPLH